MSDAEGNPIPGLLEARGIVLHMLRTTETMRRETNDPIISASLGAPVMLYHGVLQRLEDRMRELGHGL